jgi:hypothetical protein
MKLILVKRFGALLGLLWWGAAPVPTPAYPPAPDHLIYGTVRNEYGDPLDLSGGTVFIQSTNGTSASVPVASSSTDPGINYRLVVPMDSARSPRPEPAWDGSLRQSEPFQLRVQIGVTTYLPIEMVLGARSLGEPAGSTRLDLTLGVDSDGDGLPDAWERANGLNPNDPTDADGDADGDGMSNRKEYLAGTYAFDPSDGFTLTLTGVQNGNSTLQFLTVRGRTYLIQASPDLKTWSPVDFRVLNSGVPGPLQSNYPAPDVRNLTIEVPAQSGTGTTNRFFKALLQ